MNEPDEAGTEGRVLAMMKDILTRVARETATPAGTRHVLTQETIDRIRGCLALISEREMQLAGCTDEVSARRPRYPGRCSEADASPAEKGPFGET